MDIQTHSEVFVCFRSNYVRSMESWTCCFDMHRILALDPLCIMPMSIIRAVGLRQGCMLDITIILGIAFPITIMI